MLSFWYINRENDYTDQLRAYYRVNGGDWQQIFESNGAHGSWTQSGFIALPGEALAANVQIGFKATALWGYGVGLDDVQLEIITVPVTGVSLDKTDAQTIDVGGSVSFTATVEPENASDKTVLWSVGGTDASAVTLYSDANCTTPVGADATEVLTVYAKGAAVGSVTVTVTSNADNTKTASCGVTVNAIPIKKADFALPSSVIEISWKAFAGLPVTVVYVPDSCTTIGANAFKFCRNLTQVRLPKDCSIQDTAFDGCTAMRSIVAPAGGTTEAWCTAHNYIFIAENAEE